MAFPSLGSSDHAVVSISFDFPSNSKLNASFHCIVYDYFCADWDSLCDHLRDVPWVDIYKLNASAASPFYQWIQVGIDVYVPHYEYKFRQVSICCKRVLEAAKLAYANEIKQFITSQTLGSQNFWQVANSVLNKGKSVIPSLFYSSEVLFSTSDEAKSFP